MNNAKVDVITRTKNRNALLQRAVDSILGQTFPDWMHIIVNDGGDPASVDALVAKNKAAYRERVHVIHNSTSLGMEAASNVGLKHGRSKYVVVHDDDDTWNPRFLEKCVSYLEAPPPVLDTPIKGVATYSTRVLEEFDGKNVAIVGRESFNSWLTGISLYRIAAMNVIPPISFVYSRDVLDHIGLYREDLPVLGDWEFHLRFAARYEIGLIREELANYHHRVSVKDGEYGNSVIAGDDKHRRYEHLLRNDLLRKDLQTGRSGLGMLVNIANSFEIVHAQVSPLEFMLKRLSGIRFVNWLYKKFRYNKR